MSSIGSSLRIVKRYLGFAAQVVRDLPVHRQQTSREFAPLSARVIEQTRLLRSSAISAEDYYNLGLYDPRLPLDRKSTFLGSFEKGRYFDVLNPPVYDVLARDKVLFHLLADSLKIPTPATLATTAPGGKPAYGERIDSETALISFLETQIERDLFFKPADGSLGEGALAVGPCASGNTDWLEMPLQSPLSVGDIVARLRVGATLGRFLIQRRLKPHPTLAEIVPNVCPTVRVMSLRRNGQVIILGAALRLGSGAGPTDNIAGGGVIGSLDAASGTLRHGISLDHMVPKQHEDHPRTGSRIAGKLIPHWPELISLVEECANRLNFIPCIGWDIGVTENGPVVIEVNTRPRCMSVQSSQDAGLLAGPMGGALAPFRGTARSGLNFRAT